MNILEGSAAGLLAFLAWAFVWFLVSAKVICRIADDNEDQWWAFSAYMACGLTWTIIGFVGVAACIVLGFYVGGAIR